MRHDNRFHAQNGSGGDPGPLQNGGQSGTTLTASVDATAALTRTFSWTIDKSVAPDTLHLFRGDAGTAVYTIAVTRDEGTLTATLSGEVCVTNGGAVATQNLTITLDVFRQPSTPVLMGVPVDVSSNPVLDPGEFACYAYSVTLPPGSVVPGATYRVRANVTITNHSGHLGEPFGPSPSATAVMPAVPSNVNEAIRVDDTNGPTFAFTGTGAATYSKTFTCDFNAGQHFNTATIRETGQSDTALVTINCYELAVTKTGLPAFDRRYLWTIDKVADQTDLTLALNQSFPVTYTVTVDAGSFIDENFRVTGTITVTNPAPIVAVVNSVSDVTDSQVASVDCGTVFPVTLAPGASMTCSYSATLADSNFTTNTATAVLQNFTYNEFGVATPGGVTAFTGSAVIDFAGAMRTDVDDCVTVTETDAQGTVTLGTACVPNVPASFAFNRDAGPFTACGTYQVTDTAAFVTDDTGATGSDTATVAVEVPCQGGCTLTIGFWKTHAGFGPQPDMVTPLLPVTLGTPGGAKSLVVGTAALAVQVLNFFGNASNGINRLYAQLLAAKLNIENGAAPSAISSIIAAADTFLATRNSADWNSLTRAQRNMVSQWAEILASYNEGEIGPGHCDEPARTPS